MMKHTVKKDDKETVEDSTLNSMKAIWLRPESEVTAEEFNSFYTHLSGQVGEPLKRISYSAEGTSEFKALHRSISSSANAEPTGCIFMCGACSLRTTAPGFCRITCASFQAWLIPAISR